jgi:hypothetical protein
VLTEIRSLLDLPAGAERPTRAASERMLTTGYAYALGLEGKRLRIESRLRTLVRSGAPVAPGELRRVQGELDRAEQELARVRALLSSFRAQAL